eukprot:Polyplicarium_translucidae@DN2521_c0_g1_i1.p1
MAISGDDVARPRIWCSERNLQSVKNRGPCCRVLGATRPRLQIVSENVESDRPQSDTEMAPTGGASQGSGDLQYFLLPENLKHLEFVPKLQDSTSIDERMRYAVLGLVSIRLGQEPLVDEARLTADDRPQRALKSVNVCSGDFRPACCYHLRGSCQYDTKPCVFYHPDKAKLNMRYVVCKYSRECRENHGSALSGFEHARVYSRYIIDNLQQKRDMAEYEVLCFIAIRFMLTYRIDERVTYDALKEFVPPALCPPLGRLQELLQPYKAAARSRRPPRSDAQNALGYGTSAQYFNCFFDGTEYPSSGTAPPHPTPPPPPVKR